MEQAGPGARTTRDSTCGTGHSRPPAPSHQRLSTSHQGFLCFPYSGHGLSTGTASCAQGSGSGSPCDRGQG